MLFQKNRAQKGQNTAEYAILIALVVAAIIAMQTYAQRGLQGRVRDVNRYMKAEVAANVPVTDSDGEAVANAGSITNFTNLGKTGQYEPYYQKSQYNRDRVSEGVTRISGDTVGMAQVSQSARKASTEENQGFQETTYEGGTVRDDFVPTP